VFPPGAGQRLAPTRFPAFTMPAPHRTTVQVDS
jgi:hypothetical protein